jgi:hypothetical protein
MNIAETTYSTEENQDIPGSDGIIDKAYQAPNGIIDRYPLTAPLVPLSTITIGEFMFNIEVMSNSTVSDLYINPDEGPFLKFNVSGPDGTAGFSTVIIPKTLLWADNPTTMLLTLLLSTTPLMAIIKRKRKNKR